MSTLVKDIATLKEFVSVNFNFDFDTVSSYVRTKERKHIKSIIGTALYKSWAETPPTEGIEKEVFELLQEASSNLAMFDYTFAGAVQISNNGMFSISTDNGTGTDWWRLRDLRRKLLTTGAEAIDEALEIMEANEGLFTDWIASDGYTNFKEFFIRKTQTFQRYFNIENSRLTFLRLRPHLLKVEQKYFKGLLGIETVNKIKAAASEEAKEALRICQAAQASLCIAELADEGAFMLTPKGLFIEAEEIPGEKKTPVSEMALANLYRTKQEDGNEYLKSLVTYLKDNPTVFTEFAAKAENEIQSTVYNTGSTVSF